MAGIEDLQGMMGGAPASAPPVAEPTEASVSDEAISALGRAFNSLSVEDITDLRNLSDDLKTMSSDMLTVLDQTIQFIMEKSDQYDRAVQTLVQQGIVEPGDLPPDYVPSFFEILAGMVKDAIASPAAVPMEGPAAEMPPLAMAGGGIADLRSQADMVRSANRSGDSILAHINPREAAMLGRTQGSSINPITGLPEYGFFDSIGKFFKKAAGVLLPVALGFLGVPPIFAGAIGSGLGAMIGGANPSQALQAGLMGGVAGGVYSGISGMMQPGGTFMGGVSQGFQAGSGPLGQFFGGQAAPTVGGNVFQGGPNMGANAGALQTGGSPGFFDKMGNFIATYPKTSLAIAGLGGLALGGALSPTVKKPPPIDTSGPSQEEIDAQRFAPSTFVAERYDPRYLMNPTYSPNPYYATAAQGGEIDARVGGHLKGPGTGTSDSIPAKLSDGEFVMTARAVKGAGGGSRAAGAKRMYDMMHQFEKRA